MQPVLSCLECDQPLAPDARRGLCPACLIRFGVDSDPNLTVGPDSGLPLTVGGSVVQALRAGPPDLPHILLREPNEEEDSPVLRIASAEAPPIPGATGRYQIFGEIARGGIGAILRGRDVDLGRNLAIKVLLEGHAGNPVILQRFIEEAQIGGQLQHPGIVPVYEVGRFADGRPFFTMKLVKGQTLAKFLEDRADSRQDLPRLLAIFEQVCQTLAYAHARGVVHRDLKPSNVMLGSFGEVQVMDWGLAKVLHQGGVADEQCSGERPRAEDAPSLIETVRSATPGAESHAGSVLGTPAYMSPEQARGEVEHLDQRCDVFGLGAMLCRILTGEPPFVGGSSEDIRWKAARADLADARDRLDSCAADRELIELAKRCLAAQPGGRPRDAGVVAKEMTAYLAGVQERLRKAELDRAAAHARATEERKRRRLTLALAASILLTVMLASGGGWLWIERDRQAERARTTQERRDALASTTQAIHDALTEARDHFGTAKAAPLGDLAPWAKAREMAKRAETLADSAPVDPDVVKRVHQLLDELTEAENDCTMVARLDAISLKATFVNVTESRFAEEFVLPEYRAAFEAYGIHVETTEPRVAAERIRQRPVAIRDRQVAALDDWIRIAANNGGSEQDWLRQVLKAADADPWRNKVRAASANKDGQALEMLAREAMVSKQPPAFLSLVGTYLYNDFAAYGSAADLLRRAQREYPGDFWINHNLAYTLAFSQPAQLEEAIRFFTAALAIRQSAGAYLNLGTAFEEKGNLEEAIAAFREAIRLQPDFATAYVYLGIVLEQQKKMPEAEVAFRKALDLAPPEKKQVVDNLRALFSLIDTNKDRYLDEEELAIAFRGKKAKPYAQDVEGREKREATDEPKTGTKPPPNLNEIKNYPDYDFLTRLDKDNDGRISRQEYDAWAETQANVIVARIKELRDLEKRLKDIESEVTRSTSAERKAKIVDELTAMQGSLTMRLEYQEQLMLLQQLAPTASQQWGWWVWIRAQLAPNSTLNHNMDRIRNLITVKHRPSPPRPVSPKPSQPTVKGKPVNPKPAPTRPLKPPGSGSGTKLP
jgi:serine/threonine-protein kinase